MRLRNTLILAVVAALLAAYFFLIEQPRHRRAQRRALAATDLADFDPARVAYLSIERPDTRLEFVRSGGRVWRMKAPLVDRAEEGSVMRLLGILAEGEIARDLGVQHDLAPFGLDPPAATITVVTAAGDTAVALDVGALTVEKFHAFARRRHPRAGVLLVPTGVRRYALGDPSTYRDRKLVHFDTESVVGFTVAWPDSSVTWKRDASGEWWATSPRAEAVRGRARLVEGVLRRIRAMRVAEFVPPREIPTVRPLDAPARSVAIELAGGSTRRVVVGRRLESRVYAAARPDPAGAERIVLTDTTLLDVFGRSLADLRDRRLVHFAGTRLGRVELVSPAVTLTLTRRGDDWGYPNPSMGSVDRGSVGFALTALSHLEYRRVLCADPGAAARYGLSNPPIRFTLYDEGGVRVDSLACAGLAGESDLYAAASAYSGVVSAVGRDDLDAVIDRFRELRNR